MKRLIKFKIDKKKSKSIKNNIFANFNLMHEDYFVKLFCLGENKPC
jgi:hypothetical protein